MRANDSFAGNLKSREFPMLSRPAPMAEPYRADIDGLRAIAVLSVLAFHLDVPFVPGGFVGVDVFFVISGYLIGARMWRELNEGSFSLASFWERRVRRIFPAFAVTMIGVAVLSYLLMLPQELTEIAGSFTAASFSLSNVWFFAHAGYFEAPAGSQPLLHTWSLGVEDQFYLVLPLLLMPLTAYLKDWARAAVILVAAASLGLSAIAAFSNPDGAFYLLPTRTWELLLGTLLAMDLVPPPTAHRNLIGMAGVALVGASALLIGKTMPFPGLTAIPPCLGTALVIHSGRSSGAEDRGAEPLVRRLLSLRPMVFVGLISYSLYLWHWPVIVFFLHATTLMVGYSKRAQEIPVAALAFALAYLSWRFVERPFRRRGFMTGRTVFRSFGSATAVLCALGVATYLDNGMPSRFEPAAVAVGSYLNYQSAAITREGKCFLTSAYSYEDFDKPLCLAETAGEPSYLLVGDSHAAHLWYGLSTVFPQINFLQATASGCRPTLDQGTFARDRCVRMFDFIYSNFLATHKIDRLILAGRWVPEDLARVNETLKWAKAKGIPVTVIGPIAQYDAPLPRLLAASIEARDPKLPGKHLLQTSRTLDRKLRAVSRGDGAEYISLYELVCSASDECIHYVDGGVPLLFDDGHVTREGSVYVAQELRKDGFLAAGSP